jgi:hypothetical protein
MDEVGDLFSLTYPKADRDATGVDASTDSPSSLDHLPPPAPLPERSAAEMLAAQAASASSSSNNALFKPNTQKDLPTSPRNGNQSFWAGTNAAGGMFGAGGVTAVHTTFVPAPVVVGLGSTGMGASPHLGALTGSPNMGGMAMPNILGSPNMSASTPNLGVYGAAWGIPPPLQENMNPLLRAEENGRKERETMKKGSAAAEQKENSFEGFADSNMFTMKNMDAYVLFSSPSLLGAVLTKVTRYRMHLWGKMAAQYHAHHTQQQQQQRAIAPSPSPSPQPQFQQQGQQGEATANVYHPNMFQLQQLAHQQQQLVQQQALQQYQQQTQLQGLAARMGRSWFSSPSAGSNASPNTPSSDARVPLGTTSNLVALLSGKGSVLGNGGYTGASFKRHPPKSVGDKENSEKHQDSGKNYQQNQLELAKKQQEQAQAAMLAVVASQTILRKLGQAFWDAFSGGSTTQASGGVAPGGLAKRFEAPRSSSASGAGQQYSTSNPARPDWDADKVRKVLEGTAVLRIVDVDQLHKLDGPSASAKESQRPSVSRTATTIPSSSSTSTLSKTTPSTTATMSKTPSTIKEESTLCPWSQCSKEWCSTDTLRNVSKGGSVSVPGSPVVRAVVGPATAIPAAVSSSCGSALVASAKNEERDRKMASLLEEGMKGLRL